MHAKFGADRPRSACKRPSVQNFVKIAVLRQIFAQQDEPFFSSSSLSSPAFPSLPNFPFILLYPFLPSPLLPSLHPISSFFLPHLSFHISFPPSYSLPSSPFSHPLFSYFPIFSLSFLPFPAFPSLLQNLKFGIYGHPAGSAATPLRFLVVYSDCLSWQGSCLHAL